MLILRTDSKDKHDMAIFLQITKEEIRFNSRNFSLSELKARNDFKPFCSYVFPVSFLSTIGRENGNFVHTINGEEKSVHYWVATPIPFERFAETYHNKINVFPHMPNTKSILQIVFYPDTKDFEDALIILNQQTEESFMRITTLDHNGNEQPLEPDYVGPFSVIIPKCELSIQDSKVKAKGSEIQFTYKNRLGEFVPVDFEATVKTDKGYISHQKLDVVQGKGKFQFIPLGLEKGEKVTIKAGIGKYTDVASLSFTI